MSNRECDHYLDITDKVCPMTFVRTKLLLERMQTGETACIRLNSGEPLRNVPRSVREHGHEVMELAPEDDGAGDGPHLLIVRKG